ncbi:Uncharacterized protein HZ326_19028 [Fusarium oxysporum f. sp. albedinis]|nr:Uncharacterized protein HZ326_19028 [Fusarium oxysporum f. sp. albedinis]
MASESGYQLLDSFCHPGCGWATSLGHVAATVAPLVSDKRTGGMPRPGLKCAANASLHLSRAIYPFATALCYQPISRTHPNPNPKW